VNRRCCLPIYDGHNLIYSTIRWDAGVTCIQSHPFDPNQIAVGRYALPLSVKLFIQLETRSYDETVRIFDPRNLLRPVSGLSVGGGVWRVKWCPQPERKTDLLVACMHDGFKVTRISDAGSENKIIQEFREHESLAYGVDWCHAKAKRNGKSLVGSCSFYDHKLHIWSG